MNKSNTETGGAGSDAGAGLSHDPMLTADGICEGSFHEQQQSSGSYRKRSIVDRQDEAMAEREKEHGRSPGCMTPGEASML